MIQFMFAGEYGIVYKAQMCILQKVGYDTDTVAVKTLKGVFSTVQREILVNSLLSPL